MMNRRTLLKMLGLLPLAGPTMAEAAAKAASGAPRVYPPFLPSQFPKWDKAVDGLESAGKWAMELERAWLPSNIVFPRTGQIWQAVRDCEVPFRASAPFPSKVGDSFASPAKWSSFWGLVYGTARLRKGEEIRIVDAFLALEIDAPRPINVSFLPLRYEELHEEIVPQATRNLPGYTGYMLHLKLAKTITDFQHKANRTFFTEAFRLLKDVA